mgnify:CR=1 FL=1|tara:strand:+ start:28073 stop:29440 length:1368 start_codon:yes stop_codon:yes gene_type:complete
MTTYHEPPLQSRRAARESERAERPPLPLVDPTISVPPLVAPQPAPGTETPQPAPQSRAEARARLAQQQRAEPQQAVPPQQAAPPQAVPQSAAQRPAEPSADAPAFAAQPSRPAAFAPVERPRVDEPRADDIDPVEHTLTRRELRALREQQGAAAPSQQPQLGDRTASYAELDALVADRRAAAAPPPLVEPPTPHGRRSAESAAEVPPAAAAPQAAAAAPPQLAPPTASTPAADAQPAAAPVQPAVSAQPVAPVDPVQRAEPIAAPLTGEPVATPFPERTLPAPRPESTMSGEVAAASSRVGHWSTQAELDDTEQSAASGGGRGVGGYSPLTTSALILPPAMDTGLGGAISDTGEVFITGSVQLPRSYASHGAYPEQLESADLDHLLDPNDHQVTMTDSQPVRAMRAVSTHTATGSVITAQRPPSNRGLTILIIAAATMAALVGTIFVVAIASGQL